VAFDLYLRAVERQLHMDRFDMASAIEMLTQATDLDPGFADAWDCWRRPAHRWGAFGSGPEVVRSWKRLSPERSNWTQCSVTPYAP
jgi:hypothetical protein